MGTIIPPALFGIDPDEVWEYIPKAARDLPKEAQPVFRLKSPDAAMDHRMDSEETKVFNEARKALGKEKVAAMRTLQAVKEEDRTTEQKEGLEELAAAWVDAFTEAAENSGMASIQFDLLSACVAGWDNFRTASGKAIAFPSVAAKIPDCLGSRLRGELVEAIKKGIEITPEEKASLT